MKAFVEVVKIDVKDIVTASGTGCVVPDTTGSGTCLRGPG